ncbi:hypothetical protein GCM10010924_60850 [Rhizobium wenxiniae]|nr:hypothetical protein GCM10010924_60850 [Rhizobium wenxiniae]
MVEPNQPSVLHNPSDVGYCATFLLMRRWRGDGKAPILSVNAERVRRRSDRKAMEIGVRVTPRCGAIRRKSDGKIKIEAET